MAVQSAEIEFFLWEIFVQPHVSGARMPFHAFQTRDARGHLAYHARGIAIQPLPGDLSRRVGSPPPGYIYAAVDGDLLKLAAGTLLVVDAIEGLTR